MSTPVSWASLGDGMANDLEVDAAGLRMAAASSEGAVATALSGAATDGPLTSAPSGAGVAAVNAALRSVQRIQSHRVTGQADALTTSGARYDTADDDGAQAIATVGI